MKSFDHIFFLGIGGIGMSAIARYFNAGGFKVDGYDRTTSPLTKALEEEGIAIIYDGEEQTKLFWQTMDREHTLVVRTPAVPEDELIYTYLRNHGFTIEKRAEALGHITRQKQALCVAGTHGKTTTSTLLAHLLYQSEVGTNAFLGGVSENYHTNLLLHPTSPYVVVEADEYDRSFHHLTPFMTAITSIDPDHLDIYGTASAYKESFQVYADKVQEVIVLKAGYHLRPTHAKIYTYGVVLSSNQEKPDFYADHIIIEQGRIYFDFHTPDTPNQPSLTIQRMELGVPVWVNIENSVAAMALAWLNGLTDAQLRAGLESFTGVYRRFNIHVHNSSIAYIDDYAHHPTELNASIDSVSRLFPNRHFIAIFQPHLYTRTRDFMSEFAQVLSKADELILLPIYPAREQPIEGVTSDALAYLCNTLRPSCHATVVEKTELIAFLQKRKEALQAAGQPMVIMSLGAGDIDRLVPSITTAMN